MILDESANGPHPAGVAEIRALLHDLARGRGGTIPLPSHILTEVARLATRVGVIDHGRLVQEVRTFLRVRRSHRWKEYWSPTRSGLD